MPIGRLTALQERVLTVLASIEPAWTLTGGGALVGFYTKHRDTRDLDLFFHAQTTLGETVKQAVQLLELSGCTAVPLRTSPTFAQLDVRRGEESVIVDLVADPTPIAEHARATDLGETTIFVETPHQLLVNKLCALLSRSEIRDLIDVRVLLETGEDLSRALAACPDQDAGFSALTFSWAVTNIPIERLARASGLTDDDGAVLAAFRDELVNRVVEAARP